MFNITPDNATMVGRQLRQRPYTPEDSYLNNGVPQQIAPSYPSGIPTPSQEALDPNVAGPADILLAMIAPGYGQAVTKAPGLLASLLSRFGKRPVGEFTSRIPVRAYDEVGALAENGMRKLLNKPTLSQEWMQRHMLPPLE